MSNRKFKNKIIKHLRKILKPEVNIWVRKTRLVSCWNLKRTIAVQFFELAIWKKGQVKSQMGHFIEGYDSDEMIRIIVLYIRKYNPEMLKSSNNLNCNTYAK